MTGEQCLDSPDVELVGDLLAVVHADATSATAAFADVLEWLVQSRAELLETIVQHGALLLRGFAIPREGFAAVVRAIVGEPRRYIGGNSPRTRSPDGVYTATEFPADVPISLHNELSYSDWWPSYLVFHCDLAPARGGGTLLASSAVPLGILGPDLLHRFRANGILYVRNLHGGAGVGRSWQATFETDDRDRVSAHLESTGAQYEWRPDGGLRIRQVGPATYWHRPAGVEVWFNQADQWHPSSLDRETHAALSTLLAEADFPINAYFGDGTQLDPVVLAAVREGFADAAIEVAWEPGDVLVVDNVLVAHGRAPYVGPRQVSVAFV